MHGATTYEHHQRCPSPLRRPAPLLDRRAGAGRPRLARASRPPASKQPASPADPGHSQYLPHRQQPVLLPFLQKVRSAHPHAEIELVCSGGQLLPFLADLQLQRIHPVKLQGKRLLASLSVLWRLRRQHYDRVYVPFASSTDHLIAGWVKAREAGL